MDCAEAKLQIEPYVTGEIPADVKTALEEHLGACAECRLDVELTRASRNTPAETAPPALVEPIDPGGAEESGATAESPAAAEGSPLPAPITAPGGESWTLDSIFGSGGSTKGPAAPPVFESPAAGATNAGAASSADAVAPTADAATPTAAAQDAPLAEPHIPGPPNTVAPKKSLGVDARPGAGAPAGPAPSSEPEPPSRPASTPVFATSADEALPPLLTPAPPKKSDEPPPSDAPSWDFEPVEANGKAKPPEGSLFFANVALSRGTPRKKGSPAARLALWAGGGVLGIGLLAASIWIALTMHPPLPPAVHGTRSGATPDLPQVSEPGTPEAAPSAPIDSTVAAIPAVPQAAAPSTTGPATSPGTPATTPAVSPTPVPSTASAGQESAARTRSTPAANDGAPAHVRAVPKGPAAKTITKTMSKSEALARSESPARSEAPTKNGTHTRTSKGGEAAARTPALRAEDRTTAASAKSTESASPPPAETSRSAESASSSKTIDLESGKTEPDTTPKAAAPAPDAAGAPAPASSPEENVERPIDRLHLATLAAEQNADLPGLRKMRDTWHGFLKTSLGPDRARAKRELADCLWAIQTLTSKTSDQKEALAAYRDYVLNAPAGGADARTVARMRQLEDALTESH